MTALPLVFSVTRCRATARSRTTAAGERREGREEQQQDGGHAAEDPLEEPAGPSSQPPVAAASAATATAETAVAARDLPRRPRASSARPAGGQHEGEGDEEGRQRVLPGRHIVGITLPPVMAAAATAASAVGGLTSDSTA